MVASIAAPPRNQRAMLPRSLADGYSFGRYQVIRLIAIGGMSEVYEAVHNGLDKRVALKVLKPELAQSPDARQRFVTEGVNAARIRHTNVVDVTDVGIVDELPYLVMSLLEGEDLGLLYERQRRMPTADLIDLLLPVACAVSAGHAQGIVHRDLKPDNIFLHREGCRLIPKVLDFGVSRAMNARRLTPHARVFGTPHYMSPEQARGHATDAATDQYALGVILYEGVTGRLPRDSENMLELLHAVAFGTFDPPSTFVKLPAELEQVILRAMAHDPQQRFPSMIEFALALLPFASESAREYWNMELHGVPAEIHAQATLLPATRLPSHHPDAKTVTPPRDSQPVQIVLRPETSMVAPPLAARELGHRDSLQPQIAVALPRTRRARSLFWLGAAAGTAIGLAGAWLTGHAQRVSTFGPVRVVDAGASAESIAGGPIDVDVHVAPPTAAVLLDGKQVAVGHYRAQLPRDGKLHELRANADGYITRSHNFRDEAPPRDIQLTPASTLAPAQVHGPLATLASSPQSATVRGNLQPRVRSWPRGAAREVLRREASTEPHVAVVGDDRPKVRIVDEYEPHVRIIE